MKENSIEEDIKIAERFIKSIKTDKEYKKEGWHGYFNEEIVELARILEHILSDYKRVLKENEEFKEYNMEYKRILDLADNRIYRKKYLEERRKEEPDLLYPDADEIYRRYYELRKENEELKKFRRRYIDTTDKELQEANEYFCTRYTFMGDELSLHINTLLKVTNNSIPIQKIKAKIEEVDIAILECEYLDDDDEEYKKAVKKDKLCLLNQKRILQELLESENK